ncbi:hypothetical protein [Stenotrophomonas sp. YAU14D1_LEIMI4_1]|uniref:hypothetical protein n=1 Tax=Stenotrophomonas sp. YAU14D1_LEIMI4_1 TaxID=2072407 RepID=UPI000D541016|nr:hypothetical protein [Stenotrophomonas sp. YAU14D1_LEIMI4_1]AWH23872.1 hypothetical protein C1932_01395 [Stenotrophomonas sp. YAU14D1_LEIMI4_1]
MKRLLPLLLILPLAGFRPAPPPSAPYPQQPVRMVLVDRDRDTELRSYAADGQQWVAGERGHRYAVRLYNDSPRRVLVVLSVDGINAISGEDADPSQTGYVLDPGQSADITGWRKSQDEVAQFVFSSPGGSYASRTGRPDNIGVVGMAVFNEAYRWRPTPRPPLRHLPPPAPAAPAPAAESAAADASASRMESTSASKARSQASALGTGHGEREYSQVRDTQFERASRTPTQVVQLRYDSARNLRARGIRLDAPSRLVQEPQAFPNRYVPDPPAR